MTSRPAWTAWWVLSQPVWGVVWAPVSIFFLIRQTQISILAPFSPPFQFEHPRLPVQCLYSQQRQVTLEMSVYLHLISSWGLLWYNAHTVEITVFILQFTSCQKKTQHNKNKDAELSLVRWLLSADLWPRPNNEISVHIVFLSQNITIMVSECNFCVGLLSIVCGVFSPLFFISVYERLLTCVCTMCVPSAHKDQGRIS